MNYIFLYICIWQDFKNLFFGTEEGAKEYLEFGPLALSLLELNEHVNERASERADERAEAQN